MTESLQFCSTEASRALIADDLTSMRNIESRCLRALGIEEVVEAENGQIALEKFQQHEFAIVVTDWYMPVMDGLTLVQKIRELNSNVPIVMITSEAGRDHVVNAINSGVNDYLIKPFSPIGLKAKLDKWIPAEARVTSLTRYVVSETLRR